MKRDVLRMGFVFAAAALAAAVAVPSALGQGDRPFGRIGELQGRNAGSGVVDLAGWALDDDGVESVDVTVDGVVVGRALYGGARPDVAVIHPGFPDAGQSGFVFELDTTRFVNGLHLVGGVITATNGERAFLPPVAIQFVNSSALLEPFGEVRHPLPNAELIGNCDPGDPDRRLTVVRGFALDVGEGESDTGIGYLELLVDGAIEASTRTDCAFTPVTGGWTDCYGLRDFGLEAVFPGVPNAPHGGFRFVIDVGALIAGGRVEGVHQLSVRAGDLGDQVTVIDSLPVTFRCDDDLDEDAVGAIDLPVEGGFFGGVVMVTGWAIDPEGIARVEIWVDGQRVGDATLGFSRPEVATDHPGLPGFDSAGWTFALDTRGLSDGPHQMQVVVVDDLGRATVVGERPFLVENSPAGPALLREVGVRPSDPPAPVGGGRRATTGG
ncbi:MAG TPA: Ig-like domain-containing protein [Thermoanaerobaculia bacterium]|nr:Ig-like domain-containing protein [Thermoanaerobaculia bacterium]